MKILTQFEKNKKLSDYTTFGIGGEAESFVTVNSIEDMQQVIIFCNSAQIPFFILGKGSNCLFDDKGFKGVVILNKIEFMFTDNHGLFQVGAGYSFSLLGTQTARLGWSGLEFASGIPGSVGGAVWMNAGANGKETCETLESVQFIDQNGKLKTLTRDEMHFSYRHSSFQEMSGAIVSASFRLTPSSEAREKQIEIIQYRKKTQPLKDKSAGCVFRNPGPGIAAGALIDKSGLKGFKIGDAEVSTIHGNFVINAGKATAKDVISLIKHIKNEVKQNTGYDLENEVRFVPYEQPRTEL